MNLRKKTRKTSFFRKNQGKATLEYLLIGSLLFFFVQFILSPLGNNLKDFSGALLGPSGYYACLMQRGLLPSVNKKNCEAFLNTAKEAAQDIGATSSETQKLAAASSQGNSKSGEGAGSGENDSSKKNKKKARKRYLPTSSSSSSSQTSRGGLNSGRVPSFKASSSSKKSRKNKTSLSSSSKKKKGKGKPIKDEFKKAKVKRTAFIKLDNSSSKSSGHLGYIVLPPREKEEKRKAFFAASSKRLQGEDTTKNNQATISQTRRNLAEKKDDESPFQFGMIIKFIFIGMLLLTLLFLVISYVMEFKNSD